MRAWQELGNGSTKEPRIEKKKTRTTVEDGSESGKNGSAATVHKRQQKVVRSPTSDSRNLFGGALSEEAVPARPGADEAK